MADQLRPDHPLALVTDPPRKRRGNGGRPPVGAGFGVPQIVVEQRCLHVLQLVVAGSRRAQIVRSVAGAQGREKTERAKATAAGKPIDAVPYVWGDEPIPERTLDRYIARAKAQLRVDAAALPKSGTYVLGLQWARINQLYNEALAAQRWYVCVKLIEIVNSMFGLNAAIRLQLNEDDSTPGSGPNHLPRHTMTATQARDALGTLMGRLQADGAALLKEARAGKQTGTPTPAGTPSPASPVVPDASTSGALESDTVEDAAPLDSLLDDDATGGLVWGSGDM